MVIDRKKYMNQVEVRKLLHAAEDWAKKDLEAKPQRKAGVNVWMLVDLALSTGLRVGELAAITIEDINFDRNAISVVRLKRKKIRKNGKVESRQDYNLRNTETLPLDQGGRLLFHVKEYIEFKSITSGPLFVGKRGAMTVQGLQCLWRSAIKKAGLPKELSIHSARHTLATQLLKKTHNNIRLTQKQLGHKSASTTLNMYSHISFEEHQEALNGVYDD